MRRALLASVWASLGIAGFCCGSEPELISAKKIWDAGPHNAFTDLIRFREQWYCTFREAEGHVGGDGKLRVLRSADGETWESAALIEETGIDLRDPKFSIAPDNRLMIVAGGSIYRGGAELLGCQPRVSFSPDGTTWTQPQPVLADGHWLWRVTWHEGRAYGVSYPAGPNAGGRRALELYVSDDGINYQLLAPWNLRGEANETALRFRPNGEAIALVRCDGKEAQGWIGTSQAPYRDWTWRQLPERCGGPNFVILENGDMWAAGRRTTGPAQTVVARLTPATYEPLLTLPSGGDTSYPGLVYHDDRLWVSYYSSHEGKTSIYLAQVKLPEPAPDSQ